MKAYQLFIPALLCLLAALLVKSEASDDELRRLNDRLFEITNALQARMDNNRMTDPDFFVNEEDKRGMNPWGNLVAHSGFAYGKRSGTLGAANTRDRTKKTRYPYGNMVALSGLPYGKRSDTQDDERTIRARSFFHSGLPYGKRAEYQTDEFETYNDSPMKKNGFRSFVGNSGMVLGKRNAPEPQE